MKHTYFDEEGNIISNDLYLEEIMEPTQKKENRLDVNLKHKAEKCMLEKLTSRNSNAKQWLETFEKECKRIQIDNDYIKIEALRLFLDSSCAD